MAPEEAAIAKKAVAGVEGIQQVVALFSVESPEMIEMRMKNNTNSQKNSESSAQ